MNKLTEIPIIPGLIANASSYTSEAIDMAKYSNVWRLSLQYTISAGIGQMKIEPLGSNDGVNFVDLGIDIDTDAVAGNYPPTVFDPALCRWMKIKFTENSGVGGRTVTVRSVLNIQ